MQIYETFCNYDVIALTFFDMLRSEAGGEALIDLLARCFLSSQNHLRCHP